MREAIDLFNQAVLVSLNTKNGNLFISFVGEKLDRLRDIFYNWYNGGSRGFS